jgi:hypothetical protein
MVSQMDVGIQVSEAEEAGVGASTKRHNLFWRGGIGEEKLGDKLVNC